MLRNKEVNILIFLACVFYVVKVSTDRLISQLPNSGKINLPKTGGDRFEVKSLLGCAILCDTFDCKSMKYDEANEVCVLYKEIEEIYTPDSSIAGSVYMTKEAKYCKYPEYDYIWELDICVKFYNETEDKTNWHNSQARCENEAGNLIILSNQLKNMAFLPYLNAKHDITGISKWWIGANDIEEEGIFRWVSGTKMKYKYWYFGEPDNTDSGYGNSTADCALYYFLENKQLFKWFDRRCETNLSSICENNVFA